MSNINIVLKQGFPLKFGNGLMISRCSFSSFCFTLDFHLNGFGMLWLYNLRSSSSYTYMFMAIVTVIYTEYVHSGIIQIILQRYPNVKPVLSLKLLFPCHFLLFPRSISLSRLVNFSSRKQHRTSGTEVDRGKVKIHTEMKVYN